MAEPSETRSSIAARANDLESIRSSLIDAAGVSAGLWLSYLFAIFYLFVAAAGIKHRDLLFENPIKMPFLSLDLPLRGFFWLAPFLLLILHAYVLLHFSLLARKVELFDTELRKQIQSKITDSPLRARLRRQLPINIFVQILAGPKEIREGRLGMLLKIISWISLVLAPVCLLIFLELQFLPYHDGKITWWHRISVFIDLLLLWTLWPGIMQFEKQEEQWLRIGEATACCLIQIMAASFALLSPTPWYAITVPVFFITFCFMKWRRVLGQKNDREGPALETKTSQRPRLPSIARPLLIFLSVGSLVFVMAIANFPGEWLELNLAWFPFRQTLVNGDDDFITRRPNSLWSNHLVLSGLEPKSNTEATSLRGRDLARANFIGANLKGMDFEGANLRGVGFDRARLQGARFNRAQLQGSRFIGAELDGSTFFMAHLEGATFHAAYLVGASFKKTHLSATGFTQARLQGALFDEAILLGASLDEAQLQGATFGGAVLSTVSIQGAFVWKAEIRNRNLCNLDFSRVENLEQEHLALMCTDTDNTEMKCDDPGGFESIKKLIGNDGLLPEKNKEIQKKLDKLTPEYPTYNNQPTSVLENIDNYLDSYWSEYSEYSRNNGLYLENLFRVIEEVGC